MIKEEGYETSMEKVLEFAHESFLRLLPKIQTEVNFTKPYCLVLCLCTCAHSVQPRLRSRVNYSNFNLKPLLDYYS